jgi:hypothetical protein
MPTTLELTPDTLVVHIDGADKLWALKSRLTIPTSNVVGARGASDEARKWLHGIRLGGAHLPGVISAGRFYSHGEMVFWDVHDSDKAIAIDLRDEHYGHLVIEVDDPEREIGRIQQAAGVGVPA